MNSVPLKRVAQIVAGQSPSSDDVEPYAGRHPFLQGNAEFDTRSPEPRLQCSTATKTALQGDILLSVRAPVGALNIADRSYGIGRGLCAIRARGPIAGYLWWYLKSQTSQLRSVATGSTFEAVSAADVGALEIPVIADKQMASISDFLDRETAKIDALIGKQEQLISTLREESDTVWSNEYDSLCSHSKILPIRRVVESIVDGPFGSSLTSAHYSDSGTRVIRLGNIGVDSFRDDDRAFIPTTYAATLFGHEVHEGDVVVAGLGDEKMPLGRAAVVPSIGPAIVKADCYRIRPNRKVLRPDYLAWTLSSPPTRNQIALLARGSTRARLNTTVVRDVEIPIPALEEQYEVVVRSRSQLAKVDALIDKSTEMIATLREYRSALITNAVTGTIDVREAV